MLVLSRKESERLIVGDNIVVKIVRIAGGSVRLGIEAPPEVQIQREEVRHRKQAVPHKPLIRVA
jgi:carbon storage regulator